MSRSETHNLLSSPLLAIGIGLVVGLVLVASITLSR